MEEEKRKRGRPKTGYPVRCKDIHIRISESELDSIDQLCELTGESKVDALLESVRFRLNYERVRR